MVPAQIVAAGVAMHADTLSQPPDLGDQLVTAHSLEIVIKSDHGLCLRHFIAANGGATITWKSRGNHLEITWTGRASQWHPSEDARRRNNPAMACFFSAGLEQCAW